MVYEISAVTWPAYAGASVALRSMSDEFTLDTLTADPARLRELVGYIEPEAPSVDAGASPHLEPERRDTRVPVAATQPKENSTVPDISPYVTREEKVARVLEIERELETLDTQFDGKLPEEPQARWDDFVAEKAALFEAIDAFDARIQDIVDNWPQQVDGERAVALGAPRPPALKVIVEQYVEDFLHR
jgi:hypothetical protein